MRKLIHVCAGSVLALGLAACTGTDDGDDTSTSVGTATDSTTATASATDTTSDGTGSGTSAGTSDSGSGGTTDTTTAGSSSSAGSSGGSTGGGGAGDPNYPKWDDMGDCPDGTVGPFTFNDVNDGTGMCAPACDGMGPTGTCPDGATGTAVGFCGFNPESSGMTCTMDSDCTDTAETCIAQGACVLPSSHCFLVCDDGQGNTFDCPTDMTCTPAGICEY